MCELFLAEGACIERWHTETIEGNFRDMLKPQEACWVVQWVLMGDRRGGSVHRGHSLGSNRLVVVGVVL